MDHYDVSVCLVAMQQSCSSGYCQYCIACLPGP
jgi:hypothetical protein